MSEKVRSIFIIVAAIVILGATILFIFYPAVSACMLGGGGVLLIVGRISRRTEGISLRMRRAMRIELFSSLLITGSAWFMFLKEREWVAILLAAAFLQLYASFIIGREAKKSNKEV
ncbi:MAG: hypothetical protein RR293_05035 [Bacteroidales bacterium]